MSEATLQKSAAPAPLLALTEDEILFRDNVRQFAEDRFVRSRKRWTRKACSITPDRSVLPAWTDGHRDPRSSTAEPAVSFLRRSWPSKNCSRADASAGVIVDVQNTLVANAILRWATEDQKKRYLPRWRRTRWAPTR